MCYLSARQSFALYIADKIFLKLIIQMYASLCISMKLRQKIQSFILYVVRVINRQSLEVEKNHFKMLREHAIVRQLAMELIARENLNFEL